MLRKSGFEAFADLLSDCVSTEGFRQFYESTGVCQEDFIQILPQDFQGHLHAIDGSNAVIFSWAVANLNWIRAGYVTYHNKMWQRTVMTYDDAFFASAQEYAEQFGLYLKNIFGLKVLDLKETELERLSSYFRELQEYIALWYALRCAISGDLILYDGGFVDWESRLLKGALEVIFKEAKEKHIEILGISKSSTLAWGPGFSRPFVQFAGLVGDHIAPKNPWYVCLDNKNVQPNPNEWEGKTYIVRFSGASSWAYRVDAPFFVADHIDNTLGKLVDYACSAECYGYPHALFRAHREIRITNQEKDTQKLKLLSLLGKRGFNEIQLRNLLLDYHDVIEFRSRGIV